MSKFSIKFSRVKYVPINFISYTLFHLQKLILPNYSGTTKKVLFINTSVLGDIVISSLILEEIENFQEYEKIYFLLPEEYSSLISTHNDKITLIPYNKQKYKWLIYYRFFLLIKLRKLRLDSCFNLTSSRGIVSDEIALLSGAKKKYCFENNWKNNYKVFSSRLDNMYTGILFKGERSEYEKHFKLINYLSSFSVLPKIRNNHGILNKNEIKNYTNEKKMVVIAPFTSDLHRTWGFKKYSELVNRLLDDVEVVLIGSSHEKKISFTCFDSNIDLINLVGKHSLSQIVELILNCSLYIGNDSGLTHIALRTDTPVIALIGGGTFDRYLPIEVNNTTRFFFYNTECFGCDWKCIHSERYCLTKIDFSEVYSTAKELLKLKL